MPHGIKYSEQGQNARNRHVANIVEKKVLEKEQEYPIMKMQKLATAAKSDSSTSFLKSHQP